MENIQLIINIVGWGIVVLGAMFAASWASFLGVVVSRTRKGESIGGRSHCICGRQLKWWENIPVFSWLFLGGKARCCKSRIPVMYFVTELGSALIAGGIIYYVIFVYFYR